MRSAIIPAICLACTAANAGEVLIAEITNEFIYIDTTFGGVDQARIFTSIWEEPTGDQSNIFNDVFVSELVDASDVGAVYSADLSTPAQAAQLARLTNGEADNVWFGADSSGGSSYESEPESTLFTDRPGPAGLPLPGPDLQNYTPTRVELELEALSFTSVNLFQTTVLGAVTVRFFAETEVSVTVDVAEANYWGLTGDPDNESQIFDLNASLGLPRNSPMFVRAVSTEWDLTSIPPSPGFHALTAFDFRNDGTSTFSYFPASFDFLVGPVTNQPAGLGLTFFEEPFLPFSDLGIIRIGFEDHVKDDIPGAPDAFISPGTASFIVIPACNRADRQQPLGVLDLADVNRFVGCFGFQLQCADIAPPYGVLDLNDINTFVEDFTAGCP